MIDSFQFTSQNQPRDNNNANLTTSNATVQVQPNNDSQPSNIDPCSIISVRLARGEIPIEEFERLRETLQC